MNIRQCSNCGRLFQSFGNAICMDCTDEMDRCYIQVRDYIYAHPEATIAEITEQTGVKEKWIMEFLREERLTLGTASGLLNCEQCGRPIQSGRLCEGCRDRLQKELQRVIPDRTPEAREQKKEPLTFTSHRDGRMHVIVKKDS